MFRNWDDPNLIFSQNSKDSGSAIFPYRHVKTFWHTAPGNTLEMLTLPVALTLSLLPQWTGGNTRHHMLLSDLDAQTAAEKSVFLTSHSTSQAVVHVVLVRGSLLPWENSSSSFHASLPRLPNPVSLPCLPPLPLVAAVLRQPCSSLCSGTSSTCTR